MEFKRPYKNMKKIYLDYAATTPVDPRVVKAMLPFFNKKYGNTMSLHSLGQEAALALEKSRKIIGSMINAKPEEIIFTGSATESNNTVLKGLAFANIPKKNHLIISSIEHDCVLESASWLEKQGFEVTRLKVNREGFVNLEELRKTIKKETLLVSIIHGNNEIGTIQDIEAIGKICYEKNVFFHTDASQSLGKVDIDVRKMNIDLLTASSHKIYGPKGAALLYKREGIMIEPLLHGGGHEMGLRSSTSNVPAIVGFAEACRILINEGKEENQRLTILRDMLIDEILRSIKETKLNGDNKKRLSNNVNISFYGVEGESLTMELDFNGIEVSTGSACSSRTLVPSHVLLAIGLPPEEAHGSIRFSLGRWTREQDIKTTIKTLEKVVKKLKKYSPFK